MSNRQSGRTTRQMQAAPFGAAFVWCNGMTEYPQELARALGRTDLIIRPLSWLSPQNVMGRKFSGIVIDHHADLSLCQCTVLGYMRAVGIKVND